MGKPDAFLSHPFIPCTFCPPNSIVVVGGEGEAEDGNSATTFSFFSGEFTFQSRRPKCLRGQSGLELRKGGGCESLSLLVLSLSDKTLEPNSFAPLSPATTTSCGAHGAVHAHRERNENGEDRASERARMDDISIKFQKSKGRVAGSSSLALFKR